MSDDLCVTVEIYNVRKGRITSLRYGDDIFYLRKATVKNLEGFHPKVRNFVMSKDVGCLIKYEDFRKVSPKKTEDKLDEYIADMIREGLLLQMGKNLFKVVYNGKDSKKK